MDPAGSKTLTPPKLADPAGGELPLHVGRIGRILIRPFAVTVHKRRQLAMTERELFLFDLRGYVVIEDVLTALGVTEE